MLLRTFVLFVALTIPVMPARAALSPASANVLRLFVDATEAPRGILHVRLELAVKPGPLTLYYPKWIQGEHGPSGPIEEVAGLRLTCGGRTVSWERDPVDMYAIHCRVPAGASRLDVAFDALQSGVGIFSSGISTTSQLAVLNWNQLVVYPPVKSTDQLIVAAHLRLPAGWEYGTALETASQGDGEIAFAPVSLYTLLDSPLAAGAHHRRIDLSPGTVPAHAIDIVCDSDAGLAASPAIVASWQRLINEAEALFGARHYQRYNFLLTLSDHVAHFGLEHHQSSDNRLHERALVDAGLWKASNSLLPHEYIHSWVGKYRRPAGLAQTDYQKPLQDELLWVYEGLTTYLGFVLTARAGLATPEWQRAVLAYEAAWLDQEPGRTWRPLKDTTIGAQFLYGAPAAWRFWRRGVDFYSEGLLIWLEADVLIRQKTGGERSLDDFCRRFAGGTSGPPTVVTHTLDDVVETLNQVAPYDWRGFLAARIDAVTERAPLGGITGGGWQLAWVDTASEAITANEKAWDYVDELFSVGITMDKDAVLTDALVGKPAAKAGMGPGMKLLGVNGRRFSVDRLREAVHAGKPGDAHLELLAEQGEYLCTFRLDWPGGPAYPALARDASKTDWLSEILKPRTAPVPVEPK